MLQASLAVLCLAQPTQRPASLQDEGVRQFELPDLLLSATGARVATAEDWAAHRRGEIVGLFESEVYGRAPKGKPVTLRFEVREAGTLVFNGLGLRRQVRIHIGDEPGGPHLDLLVYLPRHVSGPVPAFLGLNFNGNHSVSSDPGIFLSESWIPGDAPGTVKNRATEAARGKASSRWLVETVLQRGFATATAYGGDLCPDHPGGLSEGFQRWRGGAAVEEREESEWGALGIWAWALSRCLDYLETDPDIDAKSVVVHGHSRLGKAALWAGATDQRFAGVISNNSGCGGAALSKRLHGETVFEINRRFPHWFSKRFRSYNNQEQNLPIDQHGLLALIAPRPLYVASAEGDAWADPRGEFLAVRHAEPVYALFGKKGPGLAELPPLHTPVGETLCYHIREGVHDINAYDWEHYLGFMERQVRR